MKPRTLETTPTTHNTSINNLSSSDRKRKYEFRPLPAAERKEKQKIELDNNKAAAAIEATDSPVQLGEWTKRMRAEGPIR